MICRCEQCPANCDANHVGRKIYQSWIVPDCWHLDNLPADSDNKGQDSRKRQTISTNSNRCESEYEGRRADMRHLCQGVCNRLPAEIPIKHRFAISLVRLSCRPQAGGPEGQEGDPACLPDQFLHECMIPIGSFPLPHQASPRKVGKTWAVGRETGALFVSLRLVSELPLEFGGANRRPAMLAGAIPSARCRGLTCRKAHRPARTAAWQ